MAVRSLPHGLESETIAMVCCSIERLSLHKASDEPKNNLLCQTAEAYRPYLGKSRSSFSSPFLSLVFPFLCFFRIALKLVSHQSQSVVLLTGSREGIDGSIIWAGEHKKALPPAVHSMPLQAAGASHFISLGEQPHCK